MSAVGDGRRLRRRLLWAVAAQVSSSATNLALYVGILVSSDTDDFGRWVAVLAVYHLALALSRSLVSEPMVANDRPTTTTGAFSWAWARSRYGLIGGGAGLGVVVVGWLVEADLRTVVALAVVVPALIGQDGVRNLAWARRRPGLAVTLDLGWLAVTGSLLVWLLLAQSVRPVGLVWSWLAGGLVSAVLAARLTGRLGRAAPSTTGGVVPPTDERQLHARRHSHAMLITARNLLPIAVALVVDPVAAGLLKAAVLAFTPMLTLFAGLRLIVLPAMQRATEAEPGPDGRSALDLLVTRLLGWYAVAATTTAVATVAAVTIAAESLDRPIDGNLLRWGAVVAVLTVVVRPLAEAIGFGRRRASAVRLRLAEMTIEWAGVFGAALLVGPDAAAVGWAVGMAAGGLVWVRAGFAPAMADRSTAGVESTSGRVRH